MRKNDPKLLWTAREVARYLRVQPRTVLAWCREGRVPHLAIGPKVIRFDPAEIFVWAASRGTACRCNDDGGTPSQPTTTT